MQRLEITLDSPAENVALDEALLLHAEEAGAEWLRIWEPGETLVVVGRNSSLSDEVDLSACREDGVSVLRRCSGGHAIAAAPGCLMYAVVLSYERQPQLRAIDAAHRFVLERTAAALRELGPNVERKGTSDLAVGDRKVSGNSLRCRRTHLLYHGTILYDMPLDLIARYLKTPPREPDYRGGRTHEDFVANLEVSRAAIVDTLCRAWSTPRTCNEWPRVMTEELVRDKYGTHAWTFKIA